MTISRVSWWRGYSRVGEGERDEGGASSNLSAKDSGCGALSILSAKGRGVLAGEDIVVECMTMGVGWVVRFQIALGYLL